MSKLMYRFYPESKFGDFSSVDGTVAFYFRVQSLLHDDAVVVDLGCGRGAAAADQVPVRRKLLDLRGAGRKIIGIDVDRAGAENPLIDEFRPILDTENWPIGAGEADLCVCDYVLEHVHDPNRFLTEVFRILKPGGYFCARTPNAWGYVGMISRLVPNRLHAKLVGKVQEDRREEDVFPTFYRCNSLFRLRRQLKRVGFDAYACGYEAEPNYLTFSPMLYRLGVIYQRLAPSCMRNGIVVFARKPLSE